MKRKKILAVLCFLLAGVCVMGIVEAQTREHEHGSVWKAGAVNFMEEIQTADTMDGQKIDYESAMSYEPNEVEITDQSKMISHTYILDDGREITYESATVYTPKEVGNAGQASHTYIPNP